MLYAGADELQRTHFDAGVQDAIAMDLPQPEKLLKPGLNHMRVEITGRNVLPYTASWSYRTRQPDSSADCPVDLQTHLSRSSLREGAAVRLTVRVANKLDRGQGMTVAIVGLPGGLALPEDLKQLKDAARLRDNGSRPGLISAFEIRGRELVLYWRDMAPKQKLEVNLALVGRVPGHYRGPASRAYLYYNADHKCWVPPLEVEIEQRSPQPANEEAQVGGR